MLLVVLFVFGVIIATSSAAFEGQQQDSIVTAYSQAQVQDMNCGQDGCGEKKKECDKAAECDKKKECSKSEKAECPKEKKCCGKDGACCKDK